MRKIDLTGQKVGRLTVISQSLTINKKIYWLCACDCGNEKTVQGSKLKNGESSSCGCARSEKLSEMAKKRNTKHGHNIVGNMNITYKTWISMNHRCRAKSGINYKNYGSRGITVCERWLVYENFLKDMGERPSTDYSIDRIDNNGNYEPSNCRWATRSQQQNNKRNNKCLDHISKDQ